MDRDKIRDLIREERDFFIREEYGKLLAVMGEEYTSGGETCVFHPLPAVGETEDRPVGDPRELSLTELALLPHLSREINRFGAISRMSLFYASPEDKKRLELLARVEEMLLTGADLREADVRELEEGHESFLRSREEEEVEVIR
ncbi:MAG: hypothetical protein LIO75_07145 [Lachnospiraceae bacterium]|nr:hypothetical protein [Lachnospiraceae bacterium]